MNLLANRIFWASILILVGLLLLVGQFLEIEIPLFRILIAVILVAIGIQLIQKGKGQESHQSSTDSYANNTVIFGSGEIMVDEQNLKSQYTVIFGNQVINFKNLDLHAKARIEINTVFGETRVYIPEGMPYRIESSSLFGETKGPHAKGDSIGNSTWDNNKAQESQPLLILDTNTIFGSMRVVEI